MNPNHGDIEPLLKSLCTWLSNENITGIRVGNKITDGTEKEQLAIVVSVVQKKPKNALGIGDFPIPQQVELHWQRDSGEIQSSLIPTDVVETGQICTAALNERVRPCQGGYQITVDRGLTSESAGTLGCNAVYGGRYRLLTNNHVIFNGKLDATVYQPEWALSDNSVTTVDGFVPVVTYKSRQQSNPVHNIEDLAWGNVTPETASPTIFGIGTPQGFRTPVVGENVRWIGKTTGSVQRAAITSITDRLVMQFGGTNEWAWFQQCLNFSRGTVNKGDSGAAIVADSDNYVVGLIFAHDKNHAGYGCRIVRV